MSDEQRTDRIHVPMTRVTEGRHCAWGCFALDDPHDWCTGFSRGLVRDEDDAYGAGRYLRCDECMETAGEEET